MNIPDHLRYADSHEWVDPTHPEAAPMGISDHAQAEMTDVVYLELPEVGTQVSQGDSIAVIESVKAANDIYSPVSGEVVEVNDALALAPEPVNEDPYGAGWMIKLKVSDPSEFEALHDAGSYRKQIS